MIVGSFPPADWRLFARKVPTPFSQRSRNLRKTATLSVTDQEVIRAELSKQSLTYTSLHKPVCHTGKTHTGKIPMWRIQTWRIPIGKIPHKEILNKVIIKERNTHGIKYQSINLDGWGRECLSLLWTDGTDLV